MEKTKRYLIIASISLVSLLLSSAFLVFSNPTNSSIVSAQTSSLAQDYGNLMQYQYRNITATLLTHDSRPDPPQIQLIGYGISMLPE